MPEDGRKSTVGSSGALPGLRSGVHAQIEGLARALEKLATIVQAMIREQISMAENMIALGQDNENLRTRVTQLEEKSHASQ